MAHISACHWSWDQGCYCYTAARRGVSFLLIQKLKAMRKWVLHRARIGLSTAAADCTTEEINKVLARDQEEARIAESTASSDPVKPKEFKDFDKWRTFWESWITYVTQLRGAAQIPLPYVFRDHETVSTEIRGQTYSSTDEEYMAVTLLSGEHYVTDNKRVYDELKPLIVNGPGWAFIKTFNTKRDGRGAVLALKLQAEGSAAIKARKTAAYAQIATARFKGTRNNFTLAMYTHRHQSAHNELEELGEPMSESKKCDDYLNGIQDPLLVTAKNNVIGDPNKYQSFTACQQHISTSHMLASQMATASRNVAATAAGDGGGGGGGGGDLSGLKTDSYSDKAYAALTSSQKKEVTRLRNAKKAKAATRGRKRKAAKARCKAAAAAATTTEETDSAEGSDEESGPSKNAASQFGRSAHKKKKKGGR